MAHEPVWPEIVLTRSDLDDLTAEDAQAILDGLDLIENTLHNIAARIPRVRAMMQQRLDSLHAEGQ